MEEGAVTIGRVAGIAIRIHRSWVIIALLIAWSFYGRYALADHGVVATVLMAGAATVLFFASVLVHELAHSLEAEHRGVEVRGITLFLFGGATETSFDVERPRDEFALTAVGPFSSLVLAALFGILAYYSGIADMERVALVAGTMGWVNLALAIFNLLPGAPLDGGRILRSAVWAATSDRTKAIRVASRAGQVLGYLLVALGLLQLFFVPGGLVGGLWLAFIGWFLAGAAKSELMQEELKGALAGLTVGELVSPEPLPSIESTATLEQAAQELRRRPEDVLGVRDGSRTVGIVQVDDVAGVPPSQRVDMRVGELAVPLEELRTEPASTDIADLLHAARGDRPVVVTVDEEDREVTGVVTPERLSRVVQRAMRLGQPPDIHDPSPQRHIPDGGGT